MFTWSKGKISFFHKRKSLTSFTVKHCQPAGQVPWTAEAEAPGTLPAPLCPAGPSPQQDCISTPKDREQLQYRKSGATTSGRGARGKVTAGFDGGNSQR